MPSEEVVKAQHITYDAQEKGGQWGQGGQQKGLICVWPTPWAGLFPVHRVFYFYAMSRDLNVQSEQSYTAREGNPRHAGLFSPTPGMPLCLLCEGLRNTGGRHRAGPSHQGHATRRCQMTSEHRQRALSTWHRHLMQAPNLNKNKGLGPASSLAKDTCPHSQIQWNPPPVDDKHPSQGCKHKWKWHLTGNMARQRMPWSGMAPSVSPSAQSQISSLLTLDTR